MQMQNSLSQKFFQNNGFPLFPRKNILNIGCKATASCAPYYTENPAMRKNSRNKSSNLKTRKEAASKLRMGLSKLNQLLMSGELPSYYIGGKRLIQDEDLEAYIESHFDQRLK